MARPTNEEQRVREARALASNSVLEEILLELEQECISEWRHCADDKRREQLFIKINEVERLKVEIHERASKRISTDK